ncbi:hypothetical protein [Streptomyces sp. MMBL 11-1]|uniref:hypothetical protein n=1 Tax=Streptomyces sp. MMBL 11-1 TaxID=3026420 RepID=UPI002361FB84|nr:hypothetical protein [Streptomyces sp. MMBL 11-1]
MSDPRPAPTTGWFIDLSEEQQAELLGASLTVFCNMRATTGILTAVQDGIAYLYLPSEADPVQYPVGGSRYERVPGTPIRPALASALRYEESWRQRTKTLTDENGELLDGVDQSDYDQAEARYEAGLPGVFDSLLSESIDATFSRHTDPVREK